MSQPTLRMFEALATDANIQILAFEDQRHYMMLLCLKANGTLDTQHTISAYRERVIARALGLDPFTAAEAKRRLIDGALIDDQWQPLACTVVAKPKSLKSNRVPADFIPDPAMALRIIPDLDVEREIQKFRDWEFKTPRTDWAAVWRTWVNNAKDTNRYAKRIVRARTADELEAIEAAHAAK